MTLKISDIFIICCLLIFILFQCAPLLVDPLYFKGLFQLIRVLHDYTFGLLPIPNIYIAVGLLLYSIYSILKEFKRVRKPKVLLLGILRIILVLLGFFYVLWGFNYQKPDIKAMLKIEEKDLNQIDIESAFKMQTQILNQYAQNSPDYDYYSNTDYESLIREKLELLISDWGVPTVGRVRVRKLPAGFLLHLRTSGVYIPHALEGHLDGGLYNVQWPFTMAHEMAHGYGFTDESVCNFIAYLVCNMIEVPQIKYSAELAYWRYLARNVESPELVTSEKRLLDKLVKNDLKEIRNHIVRYKEWLPNSRDKIYDQYLKSHGVSAGIKSYDQMIVLVEYWKQREGDLNH